MMMMLFCNLVAFLALVGAVPTPEPISGRDLIGDFDGYLLTLLGAKLVNTITATISVRIISARPEVC